VTGREIVFLAALAVVGTTIYVYLRPAESPRGEVTGPEPAPPGSDAELEMTPDQLFERMPGLYVQLDSAGSGQETGNLLFITADLELYKLVRSQVKYVREYVGSVGPDLLQLRADGSFSFYDYHGRRTGIGDETPAQLQPLLRVNVLAANILKRLNLRNIELSLRLDRDRPQFTEKQIRLLELLTERTDELAAYMQDIGSETLWINDYLNERLYLSDGYLVIPAALTEEPEDIVRRIADKSYEPDNMDQ
jgi:hypothetical protein